ncbi:hypothetical_protein [Leishmania braziliensis MHOM/BR/75/M2904]|uniref:Hypothetical_protein n=1 Tax=Leishmania braziliensis MHOM/BR/75/M2904 TaxID=420245 RepID=A0A3P3ZDA0_LEIBR|nr:hypothetical_protein [Leishmania braziliensis MHOM/BR/75/M2904]
MKSRDGAIDKGLARHLYRRVLRLVSVAEQPHTQRIAQVQWAEFMPSQVWIAPDDELRRIVRRSFEAPHTPSTLTNAFAFLKEARSSLFSIWVLAEWERLEEKQDPWDVYDGMALMSAALHGACVGCDSQQSFERCIKDYQMGIRSCVQNIAQSVQERMDVRSLEAGRAKDLNTFVRLVREASTLERREAKPADFSFVSLLQSHCASEYVLNIVLVFVLRALDIHSTLVGADLSFRWVRVMPRKNTPPIFAPGPTAPCDGGRSSNSSALLTHNGIALSHGTPRSERASFARCCSASWGVSLATWTRAPRVSCPPARSKFSFFSPDRVEGR